MAVPDDNITLSRETLRAELSQLELRLVDRLQKALAEKADHATVDVLNQRVQALELSRAARESMPSQVHDIDKRLTRLERFRYAIPSVAVIGAVVAVVGLLVTLTHIHA